jgi:hypothetical protein
MGRARESVKHGSWVTASWVAGFVTSSPVFEPNRRLRQPTSLKRAPQARFAVEESADSALGPKTGLTVAQRAVRRPDRGSRAVVGSPRNPSIAPPEGSDTAGSAGPWSSARRGGRWSRGGTRLSGSGGTCRRGQAPAGRSPRRDGGEGGIRTHEVFRLCAFQERRHQPLGHLSAPEDSGNWILSKSAWGQRHSTGVSPGRRRSWVEASGLPSIMLGVSPERRRRCIEA